jgi:hypothetical protein
MKEISQSERERRRQRIHEVKPWLKSTGAKSEAGKLICSQNALKYGLRSADPCVRAIALEKVLEQERERIRAILKKHRDAIANLDDYLAD